MGGLFDEKRFERTTRPSWIKALVCEGLGATLLAFLALSSVANTGGSPLTGANLPAAAFGAGAGYFVPILLFTAYSGAHLNAATTLAYLLYDLVTRPLFKQSKRSGGRDGVRWLFLLYFPAQYVGALLGVLFVCFSSASRTLVGLGGPTLGAGVSDGRGFGVEVIISAVLVLTVLWLRLIETPTKTPPFITAFGILFAVIVLVFGTGTVSGAFLNPMHMLAVMTVAGAAPSNWWVWVWGPFVGAVAALAIALFAMWLTVATGKEAPKTKGSGARAPLRTRFKFANLHVI